MSIELIFSVEQTSNTLTFLTGADELTFTSTDNITFQSSTQYSSIPDECFQDNLELKQVNILADVLTIGNYSFAGCTSLESITISSNLTSIGTNCFEGCSSLLSITMPNTVTSIGSYAFKDCSSLTTINIPDSIETSLITVVGDNVTNTVFVNTNQTITGEKNFTGGLKINGSDINTLINNTDLSNYVDLITTQNIYGSKSFDIYPTYSGVTGTAPTDYQFITKKYADDTYSGSSYSGSSISLSSNNTWTGSNTFNSSVNFVGLPSITGEHVTIQNNNLITKSILDYQLANKVNTSDLSSSLLLKADTTYVDTQLLSKANDSDVVKLAGTQTITGTKSFSVYPSYSGSTGTAPTQFQFVTKDYTDTQLGTKASTSYVDTQLATKASTSYVDTQVATKASTSYVDTSISNLVNSAPSTLNTLNELASALGNDANFSTTIISSIGTKANDADVVKLAGTQTVTGTKNFDIYPSYSGATGTAPTQFQFVTKDYTDTQLATKASTSYIDTQLATKASTSYVDTSIANLVNSAPATLDTLNELASALGNDANFSTTITNSIASKANDADVVKLAGTQTITGTKNFNVYPSYSGSTGTAPTQFQLVTKDYTDTQVATKASTSYVDTQLATKASTSYVDTQLATKASTSYVDTSIANLVNSAPATLDTLNELATALGNDANFSTTVTNSIASKANDADVVKLAGTQTITGTKNFNVYPSYSGATGTAPTQFQLVTKDYTDTQVATKASTSYVDTQVATKANDADVVKLAGTQTVTGTKNFNIYPSYSGATGTAPSDLQFVTKSYVDTALSGITSTQGGGGTSFSPGIETITTIALASSATINVTHDSTKFNIFYIPAHTTNMTANISISSVVTDRSSSIFTYTFIIDTTTNKGFYINALTVDGVSRTLMADGGISNLIVSSTANTLIQQISIIYLNSSTFYLAMTTVSSIF